MWKTHRFFANTQELPVQDCKQPRLDLAAILQLVAFGRPDIESLLGKIARVGLRTLRAIGDPPQRTLLIGILTGLLVVLIEGLVYQNLEVKQVNAYFWTLVGTVAFLAAQAYLATSNQPLPPELPEAGTGTESTTERE